MKGDLLKMKKSIIRILALALVIVLTCAVLASCGNTISGTYTGKADLFGLAGAETTYKFSGNKVKITATAEVFGFEKTSEYEGTYEIAETEDGQQTITFTFEDDEAKDYSGTLSFAKTEEGIKIGGIEYKKQ